MSIVFDAKMPSTSSPDLEPLNNFELIEQLIEEKPGTAGQTFIEKLKVALQRSPEIGSTSQQEYIPHFFRGAAFTLPYTDLMERLHIQNIYLRIIAKNNLLKAQAVKIAFQIEKDQQKTLKLYTFVRANKLTSNYHIHLEYLQNLIKTHNLIDYEINGQIIHITDKFEVNVLPMEVFNGQNELEKIDKVMSNLKSSTDSSPSSEKLWEPLIPESPDHLLENDFLLLSSNDIGQVEEATNNIFRKLSRIYTTKKSHLMTSEAAYQAFSHGAIEANFLRRYALTIRVEPILGIGEYRGDLLMLSRLNSATNEIIGKSWDGIPVLFEFKAGNSSPQIALDNQVINYLLNDLGLRTVEKRLVCGAGNFNLPEATAIKTEQKETHSMKRDFIKEVFNVALKKSNNDPEVELLESKSNLIKALQNTISRLYYLDQIVLGQLMVPSSILAYHVTDADQQLTSKLTTLIIKKDNQIIGLRIKKDATISTHPISTGIINHIKKKSSLKDLSNYIEMIIDVSNLDSIEQAITINLVPLDPSATLATGEKEKLIEIKKFSFLDKKNINIDKLRESLWNHKSLIESEEAFKMILKGILMRTIECFSFFTEANYAGRKGRADLVAVFLDTIKVFELKYSNQKNVIKKQEEGQRQIEGYKNNFKIFTDQQSANAIVMTFNKEAKRASALIQFTEEPFTIERSSEEESNRELASTIELTVRRELVRKEIETTLAKMGTNPPNLIERTRLEGLLQILILEEELEKLNKELEKCIKKTLKLHNELKKEKNPHIIETINKQISEELIKEKENLSIIKEKEKTLEERVENLEEQEEVTEYQAKKKLLEDIIKLNKKIAELEKTSKSIQEQGEIGAGRGAIVGGAVALGGAALVFGGKALAEEVLSKEGAEVVEEVLSKEGAEVVEEVEPKKEVETKKEVEPKKSEKAKRTNTQTKSAKRRKLCTATRRRRDIQIPSNNLQVNKSNIAFLLESQNAFISMIEGISKLPESKLNIRILGPIWYTQLMSMTTTSTKVTPINVFNIQRILQQSFLLGNETLFFSALDKASYFLHRDHEIFPLSIYEQNTLCEHQNRLFQAVPITAPSEYADNKYTIAQLEQELQSNRESSWVKRLSIEEHEVFIRFLNGFYSYLDPKIIYVDRIPNTKDLIQTIVELINFHYQLNNFQFDKVENIDINAETQTFDNISPLFTLETKRNVLQNQDTLSGWLNINGTVVPRTMLYDLGLQVDNGDSSSSNLFDQIASNELTEEKLTELSQQGKLRISAKNYMTSLSHIDTFSQDELTAFVWFSQLPFGEQEDDWKIIKAVYVKDLISQIPNAQKNNLLHYQLQLIRNSFLRHQLQFVQQEELQLLAPLATSQTIYKPTVINTNLLQNQILSTPKIDLKLAIDGQDLYILHKNPDPAIRVPDSPSYILYLKDYIKNSSHQKIIIEDGNRQLWWPFIAKQGSEQTARLIPFHFMRFIDSDIYLLPKSLKQEPTIATATDYEIITMRRGNDLLLVENNHILTTLEPLKGLILKQFFQEPKKWEKFTLCLTSSNKFLTFDHINEQSKLSIDYEVFLEEQKEKNFKNYVLDLETGSLDLAHSQNTTNSPVYLELVGHNLQKVHLSIDGNSSIKWSFTHDQPELTTIFPPENVTDSRISVLKYQDLEIRNIDTFDLTQLGILQKEIDKVFLFRQSRLEWGHMLTTIGSQQMTLLAFSMLLLCEKGENSIKCGWAQFNSILSSLGFDININGLDFMIDFLKQYKRPEDLRQVLDLGEDLVFLKLSTWMIICALFNNTPYPISKKFFNFLPLSISKQTFNYFKFDFLRSQSIKYSSLYDEINAFIRSLEDSSSSVSKFKFKMKKSNLDLFTKKRLLQYFSSSNGLNHMSSDDHAAENLNRTRRSAKKTIYSASNQSPLVPSQLYTSNSRIKQERLNSQTHIKSNLDYNHFDYNVPGIFNISRLLSYFLGRFKFIKRMNRAEQILSKTEVNMTSQDFAMKQLQMGISKYGKKKNAN